MTPQEKAKTLVDKMLIKIKGNSKWTTSPLETISETEREWRLYGRKAKQCALIAVDEVMSVLSPSDGGEYQIEFWEQVKEEIQKL